MENNSHQTGVQSMNVLGVAHDKLFELLEAHHGERHIIVLHTYPDPDAIASAYAHRLISAHYGIHTDIVYTGSISHGQNIALARLLKLDLIAYEEYNDSRYWRLLAEANHLDDPFSLQDGQVLVIPQSERIELG